MNANQKVIAAVCLGGVAVLGTLTVIAQGSSGFISEQYFKQTDQSLIGAWDCQFKEIDDDGNVLTQDANITYDVDGNYKQVANLTLENDEWKDSGAVISYVVSSSGKYKRTGFPKFTTITYTNGSESIVNSSSSKHFTNFAQIKEFRRQLDDVIPLDKLSSGLEADKTTVFEITGWKTNGSFVGKADSGDEATCKRV